MSTKNITVLLVDSNSCSLEGKLRSVGYSVLTAPDGEECLRLLGGLQEINLVLMDPLHYQCEEHIAHQCRIPVMFLTPHPGQAVPECLDRVLFCGFMDRNADAAVLSLCIKTALRLHAESLRAEAADKALEEQKEIERSLRKSEQFYRLISEKSIDVIWVMELSTLKFSYMSPSVYRLRGYTAEEVLTQTIEDVLTPESFREMSLYIPKRLAAYNAGEEGSGIGKVVVEQKCRDGSIVTTEIVTTVLPDEEGKGKSVLGIARDISSRRKAEEALGKALEEKDILLKELQHRVKNSLSIIHSLVGIETNRPANQAFRETLKNIQNRIRSLTNIYDLLSGSSNLNEIPLDRYLRQISQFLVTTYSTAAGHIELHMELAEILIEVKRAIPLGLIVNELLTNALKYAFPQGRQGKISITLERHGEQIQLTISDNGAGLPETFDMETSSGLGFELIRMLTDQIDGSLHIIKEVPSFVIKAPLSPMEA